MAKAILVPTSQQIAQALRQAPLADMAIKVFNTAIAAKKVDYQKFASDILPTVPDLRLVGGFHISTADAKRLKHPAYEQAESFAVEPELMVALVRLAPSRQAVSGLVYYASAPLMFGSSAEYVFVGEHIDVPAMAAKNEHWRNALLGRRSEIYSPNAEKGSPESIEWLVEPVTVAGVAPKALCATLGESSQQFMSVEELCKFLDTKPAAESSGSKSMSETDLMSLFGLG